MVVKRYSDIQEVPFMNWETAPGKRVLPLTYPCSAGRRDKATRMVCYKGNL